MSVVTRFAPSPTGSLHLGGARTALFNWLFAKNNNGKFLLRIEDTDKSRSSEAVAESIISDMEWLGLKYDDDIVVQSSRVDRHVEVAHSLVAMGNAYMCYCSEDEVNKQKEEAESSGKYYRHVCPWKHQVAEHTEGTKRGVVRLKSPENTILSFEDGVYGVVSVNSEQIDDMVILRSDATPTYLLAVVVDDHDMGVTHIIRGSDHITNTIKQIVLADALGWRSAQFFHIPLIHDEDGAKLSKRNKAPGVHEYRELGFLPEAICNYMLRLGWSHENKEIVSMDEAVKIFSMKDVGVSSACLDYKKLLFLNHHYMCQKSEEELLGMVLPVLEKGLGAGITDDKRALLSRGMKGLVERTKTITDLAKNALFYVQSVPISLDEEASEVIRNSAYVLGNLLDILSGVQPSQWEKSYLSSQIKKLSTEKEIPAHNIYTLLRSAITGKVQSPNISEVMEILGKEECLSRLEFHTKAK
ncbi:glutamate--tRNA ligase [Candidatus Anaplasma sp. TIGMIC]|uniref:glutamate--tRNA ligase n=1 Tax=Candidatus Anaplasma sp. TIGMIC TaxID=3020713 RepID=UPI00232C289E|nr:glutamate--tRNA ligase [Candidatus Anaplasma sp. TIGMIC]MDB1135777.1 glutamate--tRNA ligase [Candidatus Anaplasma sp. TIGMIC]